MSKKCSPSEHKSHYAGRGRHECAYCGAVCSFTHELPEPPIATEAKPDKLTESERRLVDEWSELSKEKEQRCYK